MIEEGTFLTWVDMYGDRCVGVVYMSFGDGYYVKGADKNGNLIECPVADVMESEDWKVLHF